MSWKRTVKGTVSRNPKSTCTPVWATLTSCINSARLRSQRSSGVSLRPSTAGSIGSIPTAYPAPAVTEACGPRQRFVNGQGTRASRAREPRGAFHSACRQGERAFGMVWHCCAVTTDRISTSDPSHRRTTHMYGMGRARCRGTGWFHVQLLLGCTALNVKRLASRGDAARGQAAGPAKAQAAADEGAAQASAGDLAARDQPAHALTARGSIVSATRATWTTTLSMN